MRQFLFTIIIGGIAGSGIGYWIGWESVDRDAVVVSGPTPASDGQRPKRTQSAVPAADQSAWMERLANAHNHRDRKAFGLLKDDIKSWSLEDLKGGIIKAMELKNLNIADEAVFLLVGSLAERDPNAAFELVAGLNTKRDRSQWFYRIFNAWAMKDPAEAFAAIQKQQSVIRAHEVSTVMQSVFSQWFKSDPETAFEEMKTLPEDSRYHAVFALGSMAGNPNTRALAFEMIRSLTSADERARAIHRGTQRWAADGNVGEVIAWADAQDLGAAERKAVDTAISSAMLGTDPKKAADWLMRRANDETRASYLEHAVSDWAQRAPNACAEWLKQHEFGPETDLAVASFANMTMRDEPSSAFEWAREIRDPDLRSKTIERVLRRWRDFEPDAAAAAEASLRGESEG